MQESEHVCREKLRGLGNYFLQYFGIWHELDSHECWRDSNFRLKGMHYFLLSLCAFLRHAGWNPESDLGKWAIIIKIIRTLRKSAHRSQPWKTARAKIKPEKSVTLGVKQETKAGSRHQKSPENDGAAMVLPFSLPSNMSLSPLSRWEFSSCLWSALKNSLFCLFCWQRYSVSFFPHVILHILEDFV